MSHRGTEITFELTPIERLEQLRCQNTLNLAPSLTSETRCCPSCFRARCG